MYGKVILLLAKLSHQFLYYNSNFTEFEEQIRQRYGQNTLSKVKERIASLQRQNSFKLSRQRSLAQKLDTEGRRSEGTEEADKAKGRVSSDNKEDMNHEELEKKVESSDATVVRKVENVKEDALPSKELQDGITTEETATTTNGDKHVNGESQELEAEETKEENERGEGESKTQTDTESESEGHDVDHDDQDDHDFKTFQDKIALKIKRNKKSAPGSARGSTEIKGKDQEDLSSTLKFYENLRRGAVSVIGLFDNNANNNANNNNPPPDETN